MRKYYGIRFHGGNRTCTTGEPNPNTGRMSIACSAHVFNSRNDLEKWIDEENLCNPSGLGGGERIAVSKSNLRDYCLGMTIENYNEYLMYLEMELDLEIGELSEQDE